MSSGICWRVGIQNQRKWGKIKIALILIRFEYFKTWKRVYIHPSSRCRVKVSDVVEAERQGQATNINKKERKKRSPDHSNPAPWRRHHEWAYSTMIECVNITIPTIFIIPRIQIASKLSGTSSTLRAFRKGTFYFSKELRSIMLYHLWWCIFFAFRRCVVFTGKEADDKHVLAVHTQNHVNLIRTVSSKQFDSKRSTIASKFNSIYFNEGSSESAYLAAGSVLEVCSHLLTCISFVAFYNTVLMYTHKL